jgi:intein/homing endonuclease
MSNKAEQQEVYGRRGYDDEQSSDFFDRISSFEHKHRSFINLFVKPLIAAFVFLGIGYYTSWLSENYVKKEIFEKVIERQEALYKNGFEVANTKLETIISQQIMFSEQFKGLNNQINNTQKDVDGISERITYLERYYRGKPTQ